MSYKVTGTNIELTRGDSLWCIIALTKDKSAYTPASGDVIRFVLKRNAMDGMKSRYMNPKPLIEKVIPNDTLLLHLEPSDTKGLPFGEYVYDIEITLENGDVDTFINNAILDLKPEVD